MICNISNREHSSSSHTSKTYQIYSFLSFPLCLDGERERYEDDFDIMLRIDFTLSLLYKDSGDIIYNIIYNMQLALSLEPKCIHSKIHYFHFVALKSWRIIKKVNHKIHPKVQFYFKVYNNLLLIQTCWMMNRIFQMRNCICFSSNHKNFRTY